MSNLRHVLGISGGKDSAALAIYLKSLYPQLDIEYYTCDTGKELDETYQLIDNLEVFLGKKIIRLTGLPEADIDPFDHYLKEFNGFLPSSGARWCTKYLKLKPFENYVGNDQVISYVGIRGDEDREGYISQKPNIQSIFPFRKNIWSEDVINKFLSNGNAEFVLSLLDNVDVSHLKDRFTNILSKNLSISFAQQNKLNQLLEIGVKELNYLIYEFLKTTHYPLAEETYFPLLENEDILVRDDIFKILTDSGVGVPAYYNKVNFKVGDESGQYARSRSGCFFCFYQQKIEWVWLYEQHPHLFKKAMEYEKDGFKWNPSESLDRLIQPERITEIKKEFIKRNNRNNNKIKSQYLLDILDDAESEGCAACFI